MEQKHANYKLGMTFIAAIFFIFGFATTFIITLSAKVKGIFGLSEFMAQFLTGAFFFTYPVLSIPSGLIIRKIGYKMAVIVGLLLMALGSFLFFPAAAFPNFPLFLTATFVLAAGVVFLQTAANPYAAALGSEESASGRLNLVQALNSIATMIAPWLISVVIFKGTAQMLDAAASAKTVQMPFLIIGAIVLLIALALYGMKLPEIGSAAQGGKSVWKYPHVLLGSLGIFFYVGAEVGIASLLVNYLHYIDNSLTPEIASKYAAIYWGGAMIGRLFGSIMLSDIKQASTKYLYFGVVLVLAVISGSFVTGWDWKIGFTFMGIAFVNFLLMQLGQGKASRSLAAFAVIAAALTLISSFSSGNIAIWTIVSIGMFNSIMFPNIFTLAVRDLDQGELSTASGIINTLICGGAVIPLVMGKIADVTTSYSLAFLVPALCYIYIFFFAVKGSKLR
jgi:MFS transporter, FHS family, L-fucose permease